MATLSASDRLPRSEIPAALICQLCEDELRAFDTELAFRGHMSSKHGVLYERDESSMDLEAKRADFVDPETLTKLKPYMALAIARHEVYGETWQQVAEQMGKSAGHLAAAARSPAGLEFKAQLQDIVGNPKSIVKMMMDSATLQMYMDWMTALQWAKDARDFKTVHTMLRDVGLQPVLKDLERDAAPPTLIINMPEMPQAALTPTTSTYEIVGAEADESESSSFNAPAQAPVRDAEYRFEDR